jgi:hypothetical protein
MAYLDNRRLINRYDPHKFMQTVVEIHNSCRSHQDTDLATGASISERIRERPARESPEYRNSVDDEFTKELKSELLEMIVAVAARPGKQIDLEVVLRWFVRSTSSAPLTGDSSCGFPRIHPNRSLYWRISLSAREFVIVKLHKEMRNSIWIVMN